MTGLTVFSIRVENSVDLDQIALSLKQAAS